MSQNMSQAEIDRLLSASQDLNLMSSIDDALDDLFTPPERKRLDSSSLIALKMLSAWLIAASPIYRDKYSGVKSYLYVYNKDLLAKLENFTDLDKRAKKSLLSWLDKNHCIEKRSGKKGVPLGALLEHLTFLLRNKY